MSMAPSSSVIAPWQAAAPIVPRASPRADNHLLWTLDGHLSTDLTTVGRPRHEGAFDLDPDPNHARRSLFTRPPVELPYVASTSSYRRGLPREPTAVCSTPDATPDKLGLPTPVAPSHG